MRAIVIFFILLVNILYAAPFRFLKTELRQPDGSSVNLYVSGDEFYNWLHDAEGYTVVQADDGYYYYAQKINGQLLASPYRADRTNPSQAGLEKGLKRSLPFPQRLRSATQSRLRSSPVYTPHSGTLRNIVIFISFQNDPEFSANRETFDQKLNKTNGPSLYHYFTEASYNKLKIKSSLFPPCAHNTNLSYKDTENRGFFQPYNATTNPDGYPPGDETTIRLREHALLQRAVNAVKNEVEASFTPADLDTDQDGIIDNICFIIKGGNDGWAELLWAHRWSLYSYDVRIHGLQVLNYTFLPEQQTNVRTLCHETFHTLGAPDLYHYTDNGITPVGIWDLMDDSDAHMSAYMKWKYSGQTWITEIPEITCPGTYTLHPLTNSINNCYKIKVPESPSEYFVLEYRRTEGIYESSLPGSGLLVYRINTLANDGNAQGPPDEVYLFRPDGTSTGNGNIPQAYFSTNSGRTDFSASTNPSPFFSDGRSTELKISHIGTAENTISFQVEGLKCHDVELDSKLIYRSDSVCQGEEARLLIDLKDKKGPLTYAWNAIPSGSFLIYNGTSASPQIPTKNLPGGTYRLKVVVTDYGATPVQTIIDTVSFVVWDNPRYSIIPDRGDYCLKNGQPELITLTAVNQTTNKTPVTVDWDCDRNQFSPASGNEINAQVLLGCNTYYIRATDTHGCICNDTTELQGHHFNATIALKKAPECMKRAELTTDIPYCPGCLCGKCFRECGCAPSFKVRWGPDSLISGNATTAMTKDPVWRTITVWVAVTDPAGCVDTAWLTIPMTNCREPDPELRLSNLNICETDLPRKLSATYKPGIGPVSFNWTVPAAWTAGNTPYVTIPTNWTGCTDATVRMTDHGLSTPRTLTKTAHVCVYNMPPDFSITASTPEACIGNEVTLQASSYGTSGITYTWSTIGSGEIKQDNGNGTAIGIVTDANNVFTLSASSGNGLCHKETNILVSGHKIQADISALPGGFTCNNLAGTLTATGSYCTQGDPIVSCSWGPTSEIASTSGCDIVTNVLTAPTTFYVDVTDNFGCTDHAELLVGGGICETKVKGDTICSLGDTSQTLYAHPSVLVTGGSPLVIWHNPHRYDLSFHDSLSYNPNVDVSHLFPGDYPLEVEIDDGVTRLLDTVILRIAPKPEVKLSTTTSVGCVGDSIPLKATTTPPDRYTYYWLNGAYGQETDSIGKAVPGKAGQGSFIVKIESSAHCVGYDTIKINSLPRALLCANGECTGAETYDALISITNALSPYHLFHDSLCTDTVRQVTWNSDKTLATVNGLQSGNTYRFYLDGRRLCTSSSVEVYKECECSTGAYIYSDSLGCSSEVDETQIHIQAWGGMYYSFHLTGPAGNTVFTANRDGQDKWDYTVNRANAGLYKITGFKGFTENRDTVGCTGDIFGTALVNFSGRLNFTISANKQQGCIGDTVLLTADSVSPGILYQWNSEKGGKILFPDSTVTPAILTGNENIFIFTANAGSGCLKSDTIRISGHQIKAGEIITNPQNGFECNTQGTLTAQNWHCRADNCTLNYNWSPAGKLTSSTGASVTTQPLTEKTTFHLIITDAIGCSDSTSITVITGICEIQVKGDTLCTGIPTAHPSLSIRGGSPTIHWTDKSSQGLLFDDPASAFPTVDVSGLPAGIYPIEAIVQDGITEKHYPTAIQIIEHPSIQLTANDTSGCIGDEITLTATLTPEGIYTYYWMNGASGDENAPTATAVLTHSGNNCYLLKAKDRHNCYGYDSLCIPAKEKAHLCAETRCTGQNRFSAVITISEGTPPFTLYNNAALTSPTTGVTWNSFGTIATLHNLNTTHTNLFYIHGPHLCEPLSIEVTENCPCETGIAPCEAGLLLETDSLICKPATDSAHIYIRAWGATAFSFRLVAPNGTTVFSVSNDTNTTWIYPVPPSAPGTYHIEDFRGTTLQGDTCPGLTLGKAIVLFPEAAQMEAGPDRHICRGQQVTLSATGNTCGLSWNKGVTNGTPFTPLYTQTYTVEGYTLNGCPATDSLTVYVDDPVKIIHQSADVSVEKGQNTSFTVQTSSSSPVTYTWQHQKANAWTTLTDGGNEPNITGSSSTHLRVQNISRTWNNTRLRCIACNKCGCDTAYFNISVTGCTEEGSVTLQMEEGITPDRIPDNLIDGWYCRGMRIGVRAVVSGVEIPNDAVYNWTVDGLPVDYSHSEYISWIPEMWEDDIVLKVCIQSDEFCAPLCAKYIRLKSKPFEKPTLRLITSVDPERTFCPQETVILSADTSHFGKHPEFQWYRDIFFLGNGQQQNLNMQDQDEWIKLIATVSDEICTENRTFTDTAFLRVKPYVIPSLHIKATPDTIVCPGETVQLEAIYQQSGANPAIQWEADIWKIGTGKNTTHTLSDKDTWIKCTLTPSNDVCYQGTKPICTLPLRILQNNAQITLHSDLPDKAPGEPVTFTATISGIRGVPIYTWFVNNYQRREQTAAFSYIPAEGDKIKCLVSGERSCQHNLPSDLLTVSYHSRKRDTLVRIYKGESIQQLHLAYPEDDGMNFIMEEIPLYGTPNLSFEGNFSYTPRKGFAGSDRMKYKIENKQHQKKAEGNVYIEISDKDRYFVPNIITPNGDGMNDKWIIEWINEYPGNTVLIFNRKNQLVYSAVNYRNDFDGNGQGPGYVAHIRLPNGIYSYVIDLGNNVKLKSWLEIRR